MFTIKDIKSDIDLFRKKVRYIKALGYNPVKYFNSKIQKIEYFLKEHKKYREDDLLKRNAVTVGKKFEKSIEKDILSCLSKLNELDKLDCEFEKFVELYLIEIKKVLDEEGEEK